MGLFADAAQGQLNRSLEAVARRVTALAGPVVVLAGDAQAAHRATWRRKVGGSLIVLTQGDPRLWQGVEARAAVSRGEIETELFRIGPVSAIVDLVAQRGATQLQRWIRFWFHLANGGIYALPAQPGQRELRSLLANESIAGDAVPVLAEAVAAAEVVGGFLTMTNRRTFTPKVSETNIDMLAVRAPHLQVEVLATRPSQQVASAVVAVSHDGPELPETVFDAPSLACRRYADTVWIGPGVATIADGVLLPPSHRHAWAGRLVVRGVVNVSAWFGEVPAVDYRPLPGTYFDLTPHGRGHFGHVMNDSLGKLWAWQEAKAQLPGLKALYLLPPGADAPTFEPVLFEAAGLDLADVVFAPGNLQVDALVSAAIPVHNAKPYTYHPAVLDVWAQLRRHLVTHRDDLPERLFVSRRADERGCRNRAEVEAWFAARGFTVIYPEELPISEQASLFGNARTVAGFAGSAMLNLVYAEHVEQVIVLSHTQYSARNEWLLATALADELHYFWGRPHIAEGTSATWQEAFHSSWDFDLQRYGDELEQVVRRPISGPAGRRS